MNAMIIHRLPRTVGLCLVFFLICKAVIADATDKPAEPVSFNTGEIGGLVMAGDHVTLIASRPSTGELVYFDTAKREQHKATSYTHPFADRASFTRWTPRLEPWQRDSSCPVNRLRRWPAIGNMVRFSPRV